MTDPPRARISDLTSEQTNPPRRDSPLIVERKVKLRAGGYVVERDPETIDTICVHQTAVTFGATAAMIKAAGGDIALARRRRALDTPYHVMVFRDGTVVHSMPLRVYTNHGNGWNARSLGLAFEGIFTGHQIVDGELSDVQLAAGRVALAYVVDRARAHGMPVSRIVAHRQSSPMRRGDPGAAIWRALVESYAVPTLGLMTAPDEVLTVRRRNPATGRVEVLPGRPIPRQWSDASTARY